MKHIISTFLVAITLFALLISPAISAPEVSGGIDRISESSVGVQADSYSYISVLSADGRYIAFSSNASNLVAGDTNGVEDVFRHDRLTGETIRLSISSADEQGDNTSGGNYGLGISGDGNIVAFSSLASNLVAGDTNAYRDVFIHNVSDHVTRRVSVSSGGEQGNNHSSGNFGIAISVDGNIVAFDSTATNLVANDTNMFVDVFTHNLVSGETVRVSTASDGSQGDRLSKYPAISADGCLVAFTSDAKNLNAGLSTYSDRVFVHDCGTGQTSLVSQSTSGITGTGRFPAMSADGHFITFTSSSIDLVSGDTNGQPDLFLRDLQAGVTTRVSVSSSGEQANNQTFYNGNLSADGHYITYESWASNLVMGDTNGKRDVFLYDRMTGETTRISLSAAGVQGNDVSAYPAVSADGRFITFSSAASNLVNGDTNHWDDVFLYDRGPVPHYIDLSISLYRSPSESEKPSYEEILGYFADTVYEISNGSHKIRNVTIYQDGEQWQTTNIQWAASEWPSAYPAGYGHAGAYIHFGDSFLASNFLAAENQAAGGYTLGHEWGHYYYGLYDEYVGGDAGRNNISFQPHTDDVAVPNSIMNDQWSAVGGNYSWLNFSNSSDTLNGQAKTAQDRMYGASGWDTLARPLSQDPPLPELFAFIPRTVYPELLEVAPLSGYDPDIELTGVSTSVTRSDLVITWVVPSSGSPERSAESAYSAYLESLAGGSISYPDPALLVAHVMRTGQGISGAGLQAYASFPDASLVPLVLVDDGIAPDLAAADGLYTGFLPYNQDGEYAITVSYDNLAGAATFTDAGYLFSLGPNGETYVSSSLPVGESFSANASITVRVNDVQSDDHGDNPGTATLINGDNSGLFGRIDHPGDVDVFKLIPTENSDLILRVTDLANGMRPDVRLLASDQVTVLDVAPYDPARIGYIYLAHSGISGQPVYLEIHQMDPDTAAGIYKVSAGLRLDFYTEAIKKVFLPMLIR
jgi:hypothetical protein